MAKNGPTGNNHLDIQVALAHALRKNSVVIDMDGYGYGVAKEWSDCAPHRAKRKLQPYWLDLVLSYLAGVGGQTPLLKEHQDAMLGAREWLFGTLTFTNNPDGSPPGLQRVRKAADKYLNNRVFKAAVDLVVMVMERGDQYGRLHLHFVAGVRDGIHIGSVGAGLVGQWQGNGHIKLEVAKNPSHVSNYVSKYMTKAMDEPQNSDFWFWRSERVR